MIAKIIAPSTDTTFQALRYDTKKEELGKGELLTKSSRARWIGYK